MEEQKRKVGRPKKDVNDLKCERVEIRLPSSLSTRLTNYCRRNGISMGEALRQGFEKLFKDEHTD